MKVESSQFFPKLTGKSTENLSWVNYDESRVSINILLFDLTLYARKSKGKD